MPVQCDRTLKSAEPVTARVGEQVGNAAAVGHRVPIAVPHWRIVMLSVFQPTKSSSLAQDGKIFYWAGNPTAAARRADRTGTHFGTSAAVSAAKVRRWTKGGPSCSFSKTPHAAASLLRSTRLGGT